jgi:hypothetical protein
VYPRDGSFYCRGCFVAPSPPPHEP